MMQFKVGNEFLELPADFGLQFTRKNPLFAFDSLECERTVSFDIPATPKNDRIFELARWVQARGAGMRRRYDAQLQGSMVTKDGYLYISEYSDGKYKAIFVTGELLGLQRIKALGKLAEIMDYPQTVAISYTGGSPSALAASIWANVQYRHPSGETLSPSISLQKLYETICAQYNINAAAFPAELAGMRIVTRAKGVNETQTFKCTIKSSQQSLQPDATQPTDPYNALTYDARLFEYEDVPYGVAIARAGGTQANQYYLVRLFKCKTALKLTMPDNMPNTTYLYDFDALDFVGGYSFGKDLDGTITRTGDPLAGRTINFAAGDVFAFVDERYYVYQRTQVMGTYYYDRGFMLGDSVTFNSEWQIKVQSANSPLQAGDICRLQDNLPDITFTELLKVIAALCGRVLNYDETNGVTFDALNLATFSVLDVSDIIKTSALTRTFADYAQNNIITLKDEPDDVRTVYTIDNDNIEAEKTLLTIPFDAAQTLDGALYIENAEADTIGATGTQYLTRVQLIKNNGLQSLCDASTALSAQIRMTLFEFNQLTAKTAIRMRGVRYTWTEAQWAKDVATIKLAKMYQ